MTKILFKLSKIPCNIYSIEYVGRKILRGQGDKFCHKILWQNYTIRLAVRLILAANKVI